MLDPRQIALTQLIMATVMVVPAGALEVGDLLRSADIDRGVAVVIASDATLPSQLAASGKMLAHLLTPKTTDIAALRREVVRAGYGGRVVVQRLSQNGVLPHPDRFVNVLIADLDSLVEAAPPQKELQRVLSHRGVAFLKVGGKWTEHRAVNDDRLDEWTHRWYNAAGNCVSHDRVAAFPRAVQWQHGPAMEDGTADGKIPRIADGRWVIVDSSSGDLICRDAGNGTLLWRAPLKLTAREDLAVVDGHIYMYHDATADDAQRRSSNISGPLVAVELQTGKIVQTYANGLRAGTAASIEFLDTDQNRTRRETPVPWFVVEQNAIAQAYGSELVVLDRTSGELLWTKRLDDATWFSPVIAGNVVLAAEAEWPARRGRHDGSGNVRAVVAFAKQDGKQLWRNNQIHPQREVQDKQRRYLSRAEFKPMSIADDLVLLHTSSYQFRQGGSIAVLDLHDGRQLWQQQFAPKERYTQGSQRAVLRGGEVVLMDGVGALRFHALTGKPLGDPISGRSKIKRNTRANGACTASRATLDWLICNAFLYVGADNQPQPHFATRGACGQGVIPAYGLIFVPPTPCDCGDYLRGHIALAPRLAGNIIQEDQRLHVGPAFPSFNAKPEGAGSPVAQPAPSGLALNEIARRDWPTFLGDPQRRSFRSNSLPVDLKLDWSTKVSKVRNDSVNADRRFSEYYLGALSAPVVSEGCVIVAAPESHQVIAMDSGAGEVSWSFAAAGKVDSPPTIAGSLAIFGCADGSVYALRTTDGEMVWQFRATPTEAMSHQHGHLASAFPLPGSVLVLEESVVAVAGHHTDLGGLHCWVLDRATGRPKVHRVIKNDQPNVVTNGVAVADPDGNGFWIGRQLHLSLKLEDLPAHPYDGPQPPIAFDRNGTRLRFRTNEGRGGSTHGWKGAMSIPGRNRLLRGHRLVAGEEIAFGIIDPQIRSGQSAVVWATPIGNESGQALWAKRNKDLGEHESYSALVAAGDRLYLGGGSRDGREGILQILDAQSGKLIATHKLPARVTECGVAVANDRLYVSCENGTVVCYGGAKSKR